MQLTGALSSFVVVRALGHTYLWRCLPTRKDTGKQRALAALGLFALVGVCVLDAASVELHPVAAGVQCSACFWGLLVLRDLMPVS